MPKCIFDFSDVAPALQAFDQAVDRQVDKVGKEAKDYNVEHGTYTDVSGHLRASNVYAVERNHSLLIGNEADYAEDVEARGEDVVTGGALYAEKRLKDIFE